MGVKTQVEILGNLQRHLGHSQTDGWYSKYIETRGVLIAYYEIGVVTVMVRGENWEENGDFTAF